MIVTPDTIVTAIPAALRGETLQLVGVFASIPLKYRQPSLTLDCTKATITGDVRTTNLQGLHIVGGTWNGALNFAGGSDFSFVGATLRGPEARIASAITLLNVTGVRMSELVISTYKNAMSLGGLDDFDVSSVAIEGMRADGIQAAPVWNGRFRDIAVHGTRPDPLGHPDGLQLRSIVGQKATANIVVERLTAVGPIQGFVTTAHNDDPGFDNLTLRGIQTCTGMPNGIGVLRTRKLQIEDCHVRTLPGSPYLSKIYVEPTCTDVTWPGKPSDYAPYRNKAGWTS